MCPICVKRRPTVTQELNTQTLITRYPAEQRDEPSERLSGRPLVEIGKLEGIPLPKWDPASPRAEHSTVSMKALREALLPPSFPPESREQNGKQRPPLFLHPISIQPASFRAQVIKRISLEKQGVQGRLIHILLGRQNWSHAKTKIISRKNHRDTCATIKEQNNTEEKE